MDNNDKLASMTNIKCAVRNTLNPVLNVTVLMVKSIYKILRTVTGTVVQIT